MRNLQKHGFAEVAGSDRRGARPERAVYRIILAGRAELADRVRELIAVLERELPGFKAGLSVLPVLGPEEAAELLARRAAALEDRIAEQRAQ